MFSVGQDVFLEIGGAKVTTRVRGLKKGTYFLVDMPKEVKLHPGDDLVCRSVHGGEYCGFYSKVIALLSEIGLVLIKYPEDITISSIRTAERYSVALPVEISNKSMSGSEKFVELLEDISAGGCRIMSARKMVKDDELALGGEFLPGLAFENLSGIIAWTRKISDNRAEYGIRFYPLANEDKRLMDRFISIVSGIKLLSRSGDAHLPWQREGAPMREGQLCQVEFDDTHEKYTSFFRGGDEDSYVITDTPQAKGGKRAADKKAGVSSIIRFLNDGVIYGFYTNLLVKYTSPIPIWIWRRPFNVERLNLRQSDRIKTVLPATLEKGPEDKELLVVDLSEGGCGIFAPKGRYGEGQELGLNITVPAGWGHIDHVRLAVRRVMRERGGVMIGAAFMGGLDGDESYARLRRLYRFLAGKGKLTH